jgi:EmrB/QacA subfamily drug resistance transporter
MCLSLVLVIASVTALNLALPDLALDLAASNTSLTWIADGYTVALAGLVLPFGAIGDRIGRRKVLLAGTVLFGAAAAMASLSDTTTALIGWRIVMGVAAAMIMPGTLSTITAAFPQEQRARGVAVWSGFAASGAIIGLVVAGALLERYSWSSIFDVSAGAAVMAGVAAAFLAPETRDDEPGRFDLLGAVLTAVAIGTLVFGIIEGNERGWADRVVIAAFVTAALFSVVYVLVGLRNRNPLLDPWLFTIRGFSAGAVTILVQFMAVFGFFFVGLQYLQVILDYSPLKTAAALIPVAAVVLPTSQATPAIVRRVGLKAVLVVGLLLLGGGLFVTSRLNIDSGYLPFLAGLIVSGLGIGLTGAAGTAAITGSLRRNQQGVASATNDATREVGSAIGIALMGSVYGSHYRSSLPGTVDQLPTEAADTVRHSAPGGLYVAERLGTHGQALAGAVKHAFIDGLSASVIAVCAIVVVAAIGCLFLAPRSLPNQDLAETSGLRDTPSRTNEEE